MRSTDWLQVTIGLDPTCDVILISRDLAANRKHHVTNIWPRKGCNNGSGTLLTTVIKLV